MGKVILKGISFKKKKGYDKRIKKNYRELTTKLKENKNLVYREFNEDVIFQDKTIRAIVDIQDNEGKSLESYYLQKSQSVDTLINLVNELKNK